MIDFLRVILLPFTILVVVLFTLANLLLIILLGKDLYERQMAKFYKDVLSRKAK